MCSVEVGALTVSIMYGSKDVKLPSVNACCVAVVGSLEDVVSCVSIEELVCSAGTDICSGWTVLGTVVNSAAVDGESPCVENVLTH